ncbi:MAG: hypothetical protein WC802_02400 [Patescibacteria group bacterium]|jgi:hypothetical protein
MFNNLEPGERLRITFTDPDRYKGGVNYLGFPVLERVGTREFVPLVEYVHADTLADPTQVLLEIHGLMEDRVGPLMLGTRGLKAMFESVRNSANRRLPAFKYGLGVAYGNNIIKYFNVTHIVYTLAASSDA